MNRKVLAVVLSLALLVGGVAIGIHILHKEAIAQVHYVAFIHAGFQPPLIPLEDAIVKMNFDGEGWEEADEIGDGEYEIIRDDYAGWSWKIKVVDPDDVEGIDPEGNPVEGSCSQAYLDWQVAWPMR